MPHSPSSHSARSAADRCLPAGEGSQVRTGGTPAETGAAALFSLERYQERQGEVLLHMSHFFLQYLNRLYRAFDGDLAMAIVLGEISHHNTTDVFSPDELVNPGVQALTADHAERDRMAGCNAYSISCATDIPRETVRRKIATLKKRQWIEAAPDGGLRVTRACASHFGPDFSIGILRRLLRASRAIEHILGADGASTVTSPPEKPAAPLHSAPPVKTKRPAAKKHTP